MSGTRTVLFPTPVAPMTLGSEISSDIEGDAKFHAQDQDVRPNHRGSKLLKIGMLVDRTTSAGQNTKAVLPVIRKRGLLLQRLL